MIQHPETTLPEDQLRNGYADLLLALARDEPEALARAAETLAGDAARHAAALPGGSPARSSPARTSRSPDTSPPRCPAKARRRSGSGTPRTSRSR